ncbi:MAG: S41 family peptidase [Armatimonadetes bacterium]|nr:S41 family peptidase [Armatimonadota bacterium]
MNTLTLAFSLALAGLTLHPSAPAVQERVVANEAPFVLDSGAKSTTLDSLVTNMNETYVDPDTAKKIEAALRAWQATPEYGSLTDPADFAKRVNEILRAQVTDAHLRFRYSPAKLPVRERAGEPSKAEIARYERETKFVNSGFEKVERLQGNVGYIRFNGFWTPEEMARPLSAAVKFLANCDAMIVDLRGNGGGDPRGVQLFCSYFFSEKPVHLNNIYFRNGQKVEKQEFWTLKKLDGPRFTDVPLFVLTSKRTGSGAEECAYDFQCLHRGPIVGESTWGGANPGSTVRLSDHFSCFIPVGRAENPYTKTNWEGAGVQPDVKTEAGKALQEAHVLALKRLISDAKDEERKVDLQRILEDVSKGV